MKELFKNVLRVDEKDGWFIPCRFTDAQLNTYSESEPTRIRSAAASAVALAFKTSAEKLSLEYSISARARDWAAFDVLSDGVLFSSKIIEDNEGIVDLDLPGDPSAEVRVYLPHLVAIKIRNIRSDAPLIPVPDRSKKWLVLGDSITQGMVSIHPSSAYPMILAEHYGVDILNQGVGGIEFEPRELDSVGFEPDMITVALGCNDWGRANADGMRAVVTEYLEKLLSLYKTENIYLITPIWRSDEYTSEENKGISFGDHREAIRDAASKFPTVKIIDGYKLLPKLEHLFGDPDGRRRVHPNDEGFMRYALALMKYIEI